MAEVADYQHELDQLPTERPAFIVGDDHFCDRCGQSWAAHEDDGSCVVDHYDEEELIPMDVCSICGGDMIEMGGLGLVIHYRCRNCGAQFSDSSRLDAAIKQKDRLPENGC
jgi:hypothetical protein